MKPILFAAALAAAAACAPAALAQNRPFDPRAYQDQAAGPPTQILVLGTPHLSGTPDDWDPAALEPLLERLAAFRPQAIMIEALSGESLDGLWRYRGIYSDAAVSFGARTLMLAALTQRTMQMEMPEAEAEVRRTLAAWPAEPSPAQRRRLAALQLAAGDPNSALVQWWRLDASERIAEDGFHPALIDALEAYAGRRNENHLIGARLAARLGLERVYPTDDQANADVGEQFIADLQAFHDAGWGDQILADERFAPLRVAAQNLNGPEQVMRTYRMLNRPATGWLDADGQWLSMINRPSPNLVGRSRVAHWETRNLRQVAHIREVSARYPGQRLLVIVGSAHKPWFDAYLRLMTDVEIVDAASILR